MTEHESQLTVHLTGMAELIESSKMPRPDDFAYHSVERYILTHGQFWTPPNGPLPRGVRPMMPKYCFDNAYRLAKRRPKTLRYVEGYATRFMAVHHAWCVTAEGVVVDPTWHDPGDAYFGQVFSVAQVRAARTAQNCSVLRDWPNGYPLLRAA